MLGQLTEEQLILFSMTLLKHLCKLNIYDIVFESVSRKSHIDHLRQSFERIRLYTSVSDVTLGSMLAQEDENGVERTIYYLSRVLNDPETRYSMIEKLCLYLYLSCTKLKHYIKTVDVYVLSHFDILKHVLSKPILHSRVGKWALALTEYSLIYMPLKATKGQVVADFTVDHSVFENSQNYLELEP